MTRLACGFAVVLFCTPQSVTAKPQHKAAITSYYGDWLTQEQRSCHLCHLTKAQIDAAPADSVANEEQPWNRFGQALRDLGEEQGKHGAKQPESIVDRVRSLADLDADGDGAANELELLAGTSPGDAMSRPGEEETQLALTKLERFRRTLPPYKWQPTARVIRPSVPATGDASWITNPIDAFIAAEHARQGLRPRPAAAKEVWLRRVYVDLIGLPPTREQTAAFLADSASDAEERVVGRLLADPAYGERWARHWMDIWRYSDWAGWGEQVRDSQPHIWRWRDWIVESLNNDKPYDEMVLEMLAADEAKPGDEQALRATGFLVRNFKLLSREQWMLDTVDHTSRAFLGVTFKCAQCHDHMYDPLRHEEYFQFRAIFEPYKVRIDQIPGELDTKKAGLARVYDADPVAKTLFYLRGDERTPDPDRLITAGVPQYLGGTFAPQTVPLAFGDYYPALRPTVVADLVKQAETLVAMRQAEQERAASDAATLPIVQAKVAAAQAELAALRARVAVEQAKYVQQMTDGEALQPLARAASLLERQSKLAAAEVVYQEAQAAFSAAQLLPADAKQTGEKQAAARKKLDEATQAKTAATEAAAKESDAYSPLGEIYPKTSSGRRLALARWITNRDNPLSARVAVNHLWARHFGRGLVETVDDFGQNGKRPVHPALLDWLATEFMEPSSSDGQPWSMKRVHKMIVLSSTYRQSSAFDVACSEADADNRYYWRMAPRRMEAEAVRDAVLYLADSLDRTLGGQELDQQQSLKIPRRSLYFRTAPEKQAPFLQIFDTAAPTECYRRRDSVIPQQALALANSELTVKQARKLARMLTKDAGNADEAFISAAFWQVLGRAATNQERTECADFLREQAARLAKPNAGATTADNANLEQPHSDAAIRSRENLVHVLFNHHDFVMLK